MTIGPQTPGTGTYPSGGMTPAQQNANNLLGGGGVFYGSDSALPRDGQVFLGNDFVMSDDEFFAANPELKGDPRDGPSYNRRDRYPQQLGSDGKYSIDEGQEMYWSLDDTQRKQFYDAYRLGVRPDSNGNVNLPNESSMKAAWDNSVIGASAMTKQTGELVSPFDFQLMLSRREQQKGNTIQSGGGGGGYTGPTTTIQNTSDSMTSSSSQSRNFLENAMTSYLGRRPKEEEYSQFLKSLNYQQEQNPTTRRTVTKSSGRSLGDAKTKVDSDTTGNSGLDDTQIAKEYAKSRSDYAETTLNTNGKNLIMKAFGG